MRIESSMELTALPTGTTISLESDLVSSNLFGLYMLPTCVPIDMNKIITTSNNVTN